MKESLLNKLDVLRARHEEISALLADIEIINDQNKFRNLSMEYAQLEDVVKWTVSDSGDYEVHVQFPAPSLAVLSDYEEHTLALAGVQSAKFTALLLPVR